MMLHIPLSCMNRLVQTEFWYLPTKLISFSDYIEITTAANVLYGGRK